MKLTYTGGSAFPYRTSDPYIENVEIGKGMTLRDWFAGQALAGVTGNMGMLEAIRIAAEAEKKEMVTCTAVLCVQYADALLAELGKDEAKP